MKNLLIAIVLFTGVTLFASFVPPTLQNNNLVIIVNPSGTPDELSMNEFRKIIMGERQRWENGGKVNIALMKTSHPTGILTASQIYKMSSDELNKYWLSLVFQGKAKAPSFFTSEDAIIEYVSVTPGAIGVVSKSTSEGVKRLKVEGVNVL